eukprot:GHVS01019081.1.p1 GENE.GHVS01019081.1~~GHVS01019081.1.p1  ORF type:complete len:152 (+),score=6.71 GHVS01019081.1:56-511(+)
MWLLFGRWAVVAVVVLLTLIAVLPQLTSGQSVEEELCGRLIDSGIPLNSHSLLSISEKDNLKTLCANTVNGGVLPYPSNPDATFTLEVKADGNEFHLNLRTSVSVYAPHGATHNVETSFVGVGCTWLSSEAAVLAFELKGDYLCVLFSKVH